MLRLGQCKHRFESLAQSSAAPRERASFIEERRGTWIATGVERVTEAWLNEFLDGYRCDPKQALGEQFPAPKGGAGMVVVTDLRYRSVCPHHLLPYEGVAGYAFWALLGPDVELRRTAYDVEAAVAQMRETDDPRVEEITEMMLAPPSRDDAIANAEQVVFSG